MGVFHESLPPSSFVIRARDRINSGHENLRAMRKTFLCLKGSSRFAYRRLRNLKRESIEPTIEMVSSCAIEYHVRSGLDLSSKIEI